MVPDIIGIICEDDHNIGDIDCYYREKVTKCCAIGLKLLGNQTTIV